MRIASIFVIEINVSLSWIFVFAFVTWALADPTGPLHRTELGTSGRVVLGLIGSLLFFGSVLVHELAHSLLARARGIRVRGITLFIFGGVSMFEDEGNDAPGEAWISGIGPLTSLVLGAVFFGCAQAVVGERRVVVEVDQVVRDTGVLRLALPDRLQDRCALALLSVGLVGG